jgi:succinoglycan biosynthesis transport protein ExoP
MDFAYLVKVLLKRKWIIITSAILASVVAWSLTRNEPKSYRSSARFSTGFAVPDDIKVSSGEYSSFDNEVRFNNAINTWESPLVVSQLSYELILHDLSSPSPFRRLTVRDKQSAVYKNVDIDLAMKVFQEKLDSMSVLTSYRPEEKKLLEFLDLYGYGYKDLARNFQVYEVQRTDYIQMDCTTDNPELSAFIVNHMFVQFLRYYRNIRSEKSQESIDTLASMMEKKRQILADKNKQLKGEGIEDVTTANTSKYDLISHLEQAESDETNKQTENYYQLRNINSKLAALGVAGANKPSATAVPQNNNEELIQARQAMNQAYNDYLKSNNDKNLLAKYNQLKTEYYSKFAAANPTAASSGGDGSKTGDAIAALQERKGELEASIEASKEKVKDIEDKIATQKASVNSSSAKTATVETLMEETKLAEKDYFDAKQKYAAAMDITNSSVNNFRQLQIAQPAIEPEPSKRMVIVAMAGAVTFMSVVVIIILLVFLDSSLRTPTIFTNTVGLRLMSIVNFMNLKNKSVKDIVAGRVKAADKDEIARDNVFRESIRKLRYEIENSGKRTILFTSTKKGQGKSTLVEAVSFSLSMSHKRVLIIDTNFSNPDLTTRLNGEAVLETLARDYKDGDSLIDKIRSYSKNIGSELGEVYIVGSKGGDYTPSEVLPRDNLLSHLPSLLKGFDYIFLEGPPLNDYSDAKELIQYVDGVVAVFSAIDNVKQIDRVSIRFYTELNGKFIGSVLNMIDLENINAI